MGLFDKIFGRKETSKTNAYVRLMDGSAPLYTQGSTNIYASDVVQQAIKCIADEMKKLNPKHVRTGKDGEPIPVNDNIQAILDAPNPLMTTSDFIEKITWLLLLNSNVFVVPVYSVWKDKNGLEKRNYEALWPLNPSQVDFIEDTTGRLFVKFRFPNGYECTVAYDNVIHIKYNFSVSDIMGGDENGQTNTQAILQTVNLNRQLLSGVAKALKSSYAINGVVKYNTMLDDGKTEAALQDLEEKLAKSESGFLPLDLKSEFIPLQRSTQLIDKDTLEFIDSKILRNWGVPLCVLTGDYTKDQYAAFYQKTLEPLVINYSQALTKALFTDREKSFGNAIELYPEALIFLTTDQTIEMVRLLGDHGSLYENEIRRAFGLPPLRELEGVRMQSLNYINSNIADSYQLQQKAGGNANETEE